MGARLYLPLAYCALCCGCLALFVANWQLSLAREMSKRDRLAAAEVVRIVDISYTLTTALDLASIGCVALGYRARRLAGKAGTWWAGLCCLCGALILFAGVLIER